MGKASDQVREVWDLVVEGKNDKGEKVEVTKDLLKTELSYALTFVLELEEDYEKLQQENEALRQNMAAAQDILKDMSGPQVPVVGNQKCQCCEAPLVKKEGSSKCIRCGALHVSTKEKMVLVETTDEVEVSG